MSAVCAPTYRWTVAEYEELGRLGVFEHQRLELLNGEIVVMSPIGYRHVKAVRRLDKFFQRRSRDRYEVDTQNPFDLNDESQPQPDLTLLSPVCDEIDRLPEAREVFLVIEVSDSTIHYDRQDKGPAYAAQAIPEFWILNLSDNCLEVFRTPRPGGYAQHQVLASDAEVAPLAFPELKVRLGDFQP